MAKTYSKCPKCGNSLEWGYCEVCDEEIPKGQEIIVEVKEASHSWIVGKPREWKPRDPEAQMREEGERLAAQLERFKAEHDGKLPNEVPFERAITDDRLYTS